MNGMVSKLGLLFFILAVSWLTIAAINPEKMAIPLWAINIAIAISVFMFLSGGNDNE